MSHTLYDEHREKFREELAKSPDRAYGVYGLSLLYSLSPDEITREKYRLGIPPKTAMDHYNLGVLASQREKHEEALDYYQKSERLGANFPELYYNLGLTHERLNETQKAVDAYQKFNELAKKTDSEEMRTEAREVRSHVRDLKEE